MRFSLNENETKKLVSLLNQHEKNLDYLLYLQGLIWKKPSFAGFSANDNDPYKKRDFLFENLEKESPVPNEYVENNIKWDTQLLRINDFQNNPYLKAIQNLTFSRGDWSLSSKTLSAYSLFPYQEDYHFGSNYCLKEGLAFFDADYIYPSLSLYGNEWMSLNPYEIRTMEVPIVVARGKVLTLGLGLGYFAFMAALKEEVKEVHIVEMDAELIILFNDYLLPLFPHPEKIFIHKADAFYFIKDIKDADYDFIFSDLWHDVGDGLESYLKLKQSFLNFKRTKCHYWIEGSLMTYLRTLVIGIIRDEYYQNDNDYSEIQLLIKKRLEGYQISNSYDIDDLLNIKGLTNLLIKK